MPALDRCDRMENDAFPTSVATETAFFDGELYRYAVTKPIIARQGHAAWV